MSVPRTECYFLLQPLNYKIMEFGARERRSITLAIVLSPLSSILAIFLCLVNFSVNVFFSLHISIATILAVIFISFLLGYYNHPLLFFFLSPPPVSAPTIAILINLLTLFSFLTKEHTVAISEKFKFL